MLKSDSSRSDTSCFIASWSYGKSFCDLIGGFGRYAQALVYIVDLVNTVLNFFVYFALKHHYFLVNQFEYFILVIYLLQTILSLYFKIYQFKNYLINITAFYNFNIFKLKFKYISKYLFFEQYFSPILMKLSFQDQKYLSFCFQK